MRKLLTLTFLILCFSVSCEEGGGEIEFKKKEAEEESADGNVSIAYFKSLHKQHNYLVDSELYISGRVVSTDQYGVFYKNIVIEDDSGGINLRVDLEDYYRDYLVGNKLKIACNSLTISEYGGEIRLGYGSTHIPNSMISSTIISAELQTEELSPTALTIDQISARNISCFVRIEGVQFEEEGAMWCENGLETGTDRHLVDKNGNRLIVRTNPNVTFGSHFLPKGSGYIEGVLGVFNGEYQLQVWSDKYSDMEGERF